MILARPPQSHCGNFPNPFLFPYLTLFLISLARVNDQNYKIQQFNNGKFNEQRRQAPNKGVQMQKAF